MPRATFEHSFSSADKSAPSSTLAKHDAHRAPRFWHAAVNVTKGFFNQPSRGTLNNDTAASSLVPRMEQKRKLVRRSTSTPALKSSASTPNLRRDPSDNLSPPVPSLLTKRSFDRSPRKLRSKTAATASATRRPAISSPSLPKPLDSIDSPHPKLAYPLSPMPSPVGSTFSLKTPGLEATSELPTYASQSDDIASLNADAHSGSRPARRRTKSAPGAKYGKRSLLSPALPTAQDQGASSAGSSPIVIDIASPSIASPNSAGSFPSPPLETPVMSSDFFNHKSSPFVQVASPRSFMSVKRKPVPRHLYMEPPEHDASAPCTPVLTPMPNSSPRVNTSSCAIRGERPVALHTPLLPSSELILKACNPSRLNARGLNLLPIGQTSSAGSARRQHRRSVSEHGYHRLLNPDVGMGLPSPWYTTNANGSMTPLVTPAEEQAPFSFANDLPAAPRVPAPQTPTRIAEEVSAFSDNTSVRSSVCRSGALSPLTDDEMDAIRSFLSRHATGHQERQRRKASKRRESHSRNTSIASCSYDMHAQIFECYATDEGEFFSTDGSEGDTDAESHVPMSASETCSTSTMSLIGDQESNNAGEDKEGADEFDVHTPVIHDEVETSLDSVNRGTFGYYGTPMERRPDSRVKSAESHAFVSKGTEDAIRASLPAEWRENGCSDIMPQLSITSDTDSTASNVQAKFVNCHGSEDLTKEKPVSVCERSSSLCCRWSSDSAPRDDGFDDDFSYLRTSHQPLVPTMSNSDSESDRPISTSASSLSPSTSTGRSAIASGIGLAIIPPEHFAYFDRFEKYDYVPPCSPSDCGVTETSEGSPTALACASPSSRAQSPRGRNVFAGLRTDLTRFQTELAPAEDVTLEYGGNFVTPLLEPPLQIHASRIAASPIVPSFSPMDTIRTYPLHTIVPGAGKVAQRPVTPNSAQRRGAASADEAIVDNVKSFMNLTPNEPASKRSRVKLRQLFFRANSKSAMGWKITA